MKYMLVAASLAVGLAGCSDRGDTGGEVSASGRHLPTKLCEVQEWRYDEVAAKCVSGQKVVFLPARWGSEQLPVIFAAVNCDLRYSVALTNGGVTCIYGPIEPTVEKASIQGEEPAAG